MSFECFLFRARGLEIRSKPFTCVLTYLYFDFSALRDATDYVQIGCTGCVSNSFRREAVWIELDPFPPAGRILRQRSMGTDNMDKTHKTG